MGVTTTIQNESSPPAGTGDGVLRRLVRRARRGYAHGEDRPLAGYTVVLGGYSALVGLLAAFR